MRQAIITIIYIETTPTYDLLMEVFGVEGVTWFNYQPKPELWEYYLDIRQGWN